MSIPPFPTGLMGAATHIFAITPHATNAQPTMKAMRADTAGTVAFRVKDSADDVTFNVVAGEIIVALVTHVRVTGTTATLHGIA